LINNIPGKTSGLPEGMVSQIVDSLVAVYHPEGLDGDELLLWKEKNLRYPGDKTMAAQQTLIA
jgi:hypothetical protein